MSTSTGKRDAHGVEIRIGDRVMVTGSGGKTGATADDIRRIGKVVKANRTRVVVDSGYGTAEAGPISSKPISTDALAVMNRMGGLGFEGMYTQAANKRGPAKPHQKVGAP